MKRVHPLQIHQNSSQMRIAEVVSSDNGQIISCRFCQRTISDIQNQVRPCQCPASIHLTCLPDEMTEVLKGQIISSSRLYKYHCQKCKALICFQSEETQHCRSYDELITFRKNNKGLCILLTLGCVIIILLLIFLVILIVKPQIISGSISYSSAIIASAITMGVLLIVVCFFCCISVLIKRKAHVRALPGISHRKKSTAIQITGCS